MWSASSCCRAKGNIAIHDGNSPLYVRTSILNMEIAIMILEAGNVMLLQEKVNMKQQYVDGFMTIHLIFLDLILDRT